MVITLAHDVESMFSANREVPWHGLGNVLSGYPTSKEELLNEAGLNWQVGELPVEVPLPDGRRLMALDKKAIVRLSDMSLLSIMGNSYAPIQPHQLVDFAFSLLDVTQSEFENADEAPILFESAMSLAGGKINTLMCRVPKDIRIGGEDRIDLYLGFCNSFDGSLRFGVHATPIRWVCRNTMNMGIKQAVQSWTTKHSSTALTRIDEARRTLNLTWKFAAEFERGMNDLLDQDFTKRQFESMVQKLFPKPPKESAPFSKEQYSMLGLLESSPTIDDGIRGTKYGALNAITEYFDWSTRYNEGDVSTEEKRTLNVLFGRAKANADKTYSYLTTA